MNPAQILASLVAQAAKGVHTDTSADYYVQAVGRMMEHASRWSAVSESGLKCSIRVTTPLQKQVRCVSPAIAACVACENPVCFSHALISPSNGDMICYGCVARLMGTSPHPQQQPRRSRRAGATSAPQCTCATPWQLDPTCVVHGRASSDEIARTRRKHLRTLDLDEDADWEDIQFAYKQLAKKHHPDKHPPSRQKRQVSRIKKINAAFAWLKKQYQEEAA